MYTHIERDGKQTIVPRLLYKSQSDGGWRVAYGVEAGNGRFIKEANDGPSHYTQETKLVPEVLDALEKLEVIHDRNGLLGVEIHRAFSDDNPAQRMASTSEDEIAYYEDETLDRKMSLVRWISAGRMNRRSFEAIRTWDSSIRSFSEYVEAVNASMEKIPGFVPNFTIGPSNSVTREHTLLGKITVEEYPALYGQKEIIWSMASDSNGRVWVDNIRLADAEASSYGNYDTIFDGGLITSKPLEYVEQASGLSYGEECKSFNYRGSYDKYVDITPILGQLAPIKQYRSAKRR